MRLEEARARLRAAGVEIIEFGIGEPREETPAFIRQALADAITPLAPYPSVLGLPELREAIAGWVDRRFGVTLDPDTEVIPTIGSKEAVFGLANVFDGEYVVVPQPAYPVYDRGARVRGQAGARAAAARGERLAAVAGRRRLGPRRDPVAELPEQPDRRDRAAGVLRGGGRAGAARTGSCSPPTRRTRSCTSATRRSPRCRCATARNVVVFNTLSKRSSMPGYRSGFVAGDPEIIAALKKYRPNVGVAPPEFFQRAAIAAWNDDAHVDEVRERYRAKRDAILPALEAMGLRSAGGDATFFLWLEASDALAAEWIEAGVIVAPGSFFGPAGEGYLRLALVPPLEACERRGQSFACSAALSPAQLPERGSASTAPVFELRRNSRPLAPLSSRALTTSPSGSVTSVPAVT